jgi:acyl-CoA dehydrogenase
MAITFERSWECEDLKAYRKTVARFIEAEIAPRDEKARHDGRVQRKLWKMAGELGLLCSDIPEQFGGGGGDFRHEAVMLEELSRRGLSGMATSVQSIVAHYLLSHGTEPQRKKYLSRLATGELIGAIAMTEPGAGSDLQAITTTAKRHGDSYVLNGSKTFITHGYLANLIVVACKTDPSRGASGTSLVIVETEGCKGYSVGRVLDKIGLKAQDTSELYFEDVEVPAANLIGEKEGQGFAQLMSDLPYERTLIAVGSAAAMEGAYHEALRYVRERKVFGKTVADFQNTRFKLAEAATQIAAARSFVDRCVEQLVAGKLDPATAAMAKVFATEAQGRVVDELLQLFGGYGYMNEYRIARMYVDARISRIFGGTNEVMKEVIARAM